VIVVEDVYLTETQTASALLIAVNTLLEIVTLRRPMSAVLLGVPDQHRLVVTIEDVVRHAHVVRARVCRSRRRDIA